MYISEGQGRPYWYQHVQLSHVYRHTNGVPLCPAVLYTPYTRPACPLHRLAGLVVKASAAGMEDPGFDSRLRRDFSGLSHTSDLKIGTPVATLPGAWHYKVSAGTGRPGVSIL